MIVVVVESWSTVIERAADDTVKPLASFAVKTSPVAAVVEVGVPLIVLPVKDNPAGRVPEVSDQVSAPVPPVAAKVVVYDAPNVALGSELVVTPSVVNEEVMGVVVQLSRDAAIEKV